MSPFGRLKMVLISLLEIKSFVSLKNESLLFWTRVHFRVGGVKFSKILRGVAHKGGGGGGLTDLEFFLGGGVRKKGVRSIFQGGVETREDTMNVYIKLGAETLKIT